MPFGISVDSVGFSVDTARGSADLIVRTGELADATIWERDWYPSLARAGLPTAKWPWRQHLERARVEAGRHCLVVAQPHRIEAMASLSLDLSRIGGLQDAQVVYVEYLGTAPENLAPPIGTSVVRGLGVVLMRRTFQLSFALGLEGRVGLHSKPESETFYRRLGMTAVRQEETEDGSWLYFESDPPAVRRFLDETDADS